MITRSEGRNPLWRILLATLASLFLIAGSWQAGLRADGEHPSGDPKKAPPKKDEPKKEEPKKDDAKKEEPKKEDKKNLSSELGSVLGGKYQVDETDHFHLESNTYSKDTKAQPEFAKRCEEAMALFCKIFSKENGGTLSKGNSTWQSKCNVWQVKTKAEWEKWIDAHPGRPGESFLMKKCAGLRGGGPHTIVGLENAGGDQDACHRLSMHNIGHLMMDAWSGGGDLPVWMDEGFASFVENEILKGVGSYCIGGGTGGGDPRDEKWKDGGDWISLIKDSVIGKKDIPFLEMRKCRDFNSMSHAQRAKSWSLTTWLIQYYPDGKKPQPEKFVELIKQMKHRPTEGDYLKNQDDVIKKVYELSTEDLEKEWRKYAITR